MVASRPFILRGLRYFAIILKVKNNTRLVPIVAASLSRSRLFRLRLIPLVSLAFLEFSAGHVILKHLAM